LPMQSVAFFIDPVSGEFGWSRTQVSIGATVFGLSVIPFAPFAGAIQDWLGPRRVAIIGAIWCTALMMSLGLTTGSLELWIGQWAVFALGEMLLKPTVWLAVVTSVFLLARGMATAVALAGTAMAQTLAPLLSYYLIEQFEWRAAYMLLGAGWGGATLILVVLFFCEARDRNVQANESRPERKSRNRDLPGLTIREAIRSLRLYRIAIALAVMAAVSIAVITHKVSILGEMGFSRADAAKLAALAGIAGIGGKLICGFLYDRSESTWIGFGAFFLSTLGFTLLIEPVRTPPAVFAAMVLFGLSSGATLQTGMYLTAQYCGQRNFGKIFGAKASITAVGIGTGPVLGGLVQDRFGTYEPLLMLGIPASFLCALLVTGLGPYPNWDGPDGEEPVRS